MLILPLKYVIDVCAKYILANLYLICIHLWHIYNFIYICVYVYLCVCEVKLGYQTVMMTTFNFFLNNDNNSILFYSILFYYICNGGRMFYICLFFLSFHIGAYWTRYSIHVISQYQLITGWLVDWCMMKLHQLFIKKQLASIFIID